MIVGEFVKKFVNKIKKTVEFCSKRFNFKTFVYLPIPPNTLFHEEEIPDFCQIRMKNVGRSTQTSAGPNSYGKSQVGGFQDSKALLKARQKQCEDLFYEQDRSQIELKRQEKIDVKERFAKEQARREKMKDTSGTNSTVEIGIKSMQNIKPRRKSRFDAPVAPEIDNSQRRYRFFF